jgi:hypothetical protein
MAQLANLGWCGVIGTKIYFWGLSGMAQLANLGLLQMETEYWAVPLANIVLITVS